MRPLLAFLGLPWDRDGARQSGSAAEPRPCPHRQLFAGHRADLQARRRPLGALPRRSWRRCCRSSRPGRSGWAMTCERRRGDADARPDEADGGARHGRARENGRGGGGAAAAREAARSAIRASRGSGSCRGLLHRALDDAGAGGSMPATGPPRWRRATVGIAPSAGAGGARGRPAGDRACIERALRIEPRAMTARFGLGLGDPRRTGHGPPRRQRSTTRCSRAIRAGRRATPIGAPTCAGSAATAPASRASCRAGARPRRRRPRSVGRAAGGADAGAGRIEELRAAAIGVGATPAGAASDVRRL